jgi:hypothetical protein
MNNFKLFPRNEALINSNAATLSLLVNIPPEYTSELETLRQTNRPIEISYFKMVSNTTFMRLKILQKCLLFT